MLVPVSGSVRHWMRIVVRRLMRILVRCRMRILVRRPVRPAEVLMHLAVRQRLKRGARAGEQCRRQRDESGPKGETHARIYGFAPVLPTSTAPWRV